MPSLTFEEWAGRSGQLQIFLITTSVLRVADGAIIPLYFSDYPPDRLSRFYLPCIKEMPRLTRQSNDTLTPNHVPTWGDLTLWAKNLEYKPDGANSISWREMLSSAYTFIGQPLVLKVGGEEFAEADYYTLFTGHIGRVSWDEGEGTITFRLYDKGQELDHKIPSFELPESIFVDEDSWNQVIPLPLGTVKNFEPVLIRETTPGTCLYALAGAVIHALDNIYYNGAPPGAGYWTFRQKDVSPANKDGEGSASMETFGAYTGGAVQQEWLVQIESISALNSQGNSGPEVGLARFRYSSNNGLTWQSGFLTWKLGYDSTTLVKSPGAGAAVLAVSGDYTGDCKLSYKVKVVREGDIGDAVPPRIIWSDAGGVTWKPDEESSWTPVASAPGVMSVTAFNPYDVVQVEITTGGNVGGAVRFRWSNTGGVTWNTDNQIPNTSPIELFTGYSVQFTAPGEAGVDDYDAGDAGGTALAVDVLSVDPPTSPASSESFSLNRGLSAALSGDGIASYWYWVGTGPGIGAVVEGDELDVDIVITGAGACGVATYDWVVLAGEPGEVSGSGVTSENIVELTPGYSVQFTHPGIPGVDDYDLGDGSNPGSSYTPAFVVNDTWTFTFKEIPIPLEDGVSVQFYTQTGQDFELFDEWRFRLISTVLCTGLADTTEVTADARGMVTPVDLSAVDTAADIIRAVIAAWAGWNTEADFLGSMMEAFNTAIPYKLGLLVDSPTAISEIIDTLLTGIPAVYSITLDGKFYLKEIADPAGEASLSLTDVEYFPSRTGEKDDENFYRRAYVRYDRNWSTNKNASGVSQARQQWLSQEWRQISRHNRDLEDFKEAHDLGPLDTCLVDRDEAALLAQKLIDLYGTRRETQQVETKIQPFRRNIWDIVEIDGLPFALKGLELDMYDRSQLTVWR